MRIDGPRNLEATAELSGSFSGSFTGAVRNYTPSAALTGSFKGDFSGSGQGAFSGAFTGDGSGLTFVFKTLRDSTGAESWDATESGVLNFTSESGGGLRMEAQSATDGEAEIYFELTEIPISKLEKNTISTVALGESLASLIPGTGIKFTDGTTVYDGSTQKTIALDGSSLPTVSNIVSTADFLLFQDANDPGNNVKKIRVDNFVNQLAGTGLTATAGVLSLTPGTLTNISSIYNSGLRIGRAVSDHIDFSTANQTRFWINNGLKAYFTSTDAVFNVDIDMNSNNISGVNEIDATQGTFEALQGQWYGITGGIPSTTGPRIQGIPYCFTGERGDDSLNINDYFAFGNGASTGLGPVMPYDGRVLGITLSWSEAIAFTNVPSSFGQVVLQCHLDGVAQGTTAASGMVQVTAATPNITGPGYVFVDDPSDLTFSAGQAINWGATTVRTSTGTNTSDTMTPTFVLTFWVLFD